MKTIQEYLTYVSEQMGMNPPASYSGRSMYGKSCVSISGNKRECMSLISEVIKMATNQVIDLTYDIDDEDVKDFKLLTTMRNELNQLIDDLIAESSQDSMGYDTVIYWEMHEWAEEEEEEEDSESDEEDE